MSTKGTTKKKYNCGFENLFLSFILNCTEAKLWINLKEDSPENNLRNCSHVLRSRQLPWGKRAGIPRPKCTFPGRTSSYSPSYFHSRMRHQHQLSEQGRKICQQNCVLFCSLLKRKVFPLLTCSRWDSSSLSLHSDKEACNLFCRHGIAMTSNMVAVPRRRHAILDPAHFFWLTLLLT